MKWCLPRKQSKILQAVQFSDIIGTQYLEITHQLCMHAQNGIDLSLQYYKFSCLSQNFQLLQQYIVSYHQTSQKKKGGGVSLIGTNWSDRQTYLLKLWITCMPCKVCFVTSCRSSGKESFQNSWCNFLKSNLQIVITTPSVPLICLQFFHTARHTF